MQQTPAAELPVAGNFVGRRFSGKLGPGRIRPMYQPAGVKTSLDLPIPDRMNAWVLGDPNQLLLGEKPVPVPA